MPETRALDIAQVTIEGHVVDEVTADVRSMVARKPGDEATQVRISIEDHDDWVRRALAQDGFAIFGMWGIPFGMTYESETVSVDVEIAARDGRTLVGHATVEKAGSLFAKARRRAIAAALDRALAAAR